MHTIRHDHRGFYFQACNVVRNSMTNRKWDNKGQNKTDNGGCPLTKLGGGWYLLSENPNDAGGIDLDLSQLLGIRMYRKGGFKFLDK
jgi:hypothetical protein